MPIRPIQIVSVIVLTTLLAIIPVGLLAYGHDEADNSDIWYRGDGLGYNVTLSLAPNGVYEANWSGCLGEYGKSEGRWESLPKGIVLVPTRESGAMTGHLRQLTYVDHGGERYLVPDEDIDDLKTMPKRYSYDIIGFRRDDRDAR